MRERLSPIKTFWRDQKGQDLIEYALLVGFLAVAVGAVFPAGIGPAFTNIMARVNEIMGSTP